MFIMKIKATPVPEKMQYFVSVCPIFFLWQVLNQTCLEIRITKLLPAWLSPSSTKCAHQPNVLGSKLTLTGGVCGNYLPYKKDDICNLILAHVMKNMIDIDSWQILIQSMKLCTNLNLEFI